MTEVSTQNGFLAWCAELGAVHFSAGPSAMNSPTASVSSALMLASDTSVTSALICFLKLIVYIHHFHLDALRKP